MLQKSQCQRSESKRMNENTKKKYIIIIKQSNAGINVLIMYCAY